MDTTDLYDGRRQTEAKHFILEQYLYTLAFKVLSHPNSKSLTFIDGFSGPWKARDADNFSDTSFGIALTVLKEVADHYREVGTPKKIHCVFNEKDRRAFTQLEAAVTPHNDPEGGFTVSVINSPFVDAVPEIVAQVIPGSFVYTFIDPKGWTGYPYNEIKPILAIPRSEVLINFMYDHINRFRDHEDPKIIVSLAPIMGGPNWRERLDPDEPDRAIATMQLARQVLKDSSGYTYALSTMIMKEIKDRPHFALMIGTNKPDGVKTFREVERRALKMYEGKRQKAKEVNKPQLAMPLFEGQDLPDPFDSYIDEVRQSAKDALKRQLQARNKDISFKVLWIAVCETLPLTLPDVKDLCVLLAKEGFIENTWATPGSRKRKPDDEHIIRLVKKDEG